MRLLFARFPKMWPHPTQLVTHPAPAASTFLRIFGRSLDTVTVSSEPSPLDVTDGGYLSHPSSFPGPKANTGDRPLLGLSQPGKTS